MGGFDLSTLQPVAPPAPPPAPPPFDLSTLKPVTTASAPVPAPAPEVPKTPAEQTFEGAITTGAAKTVPPPRNPITQPTMQEQMDINAPAALAPNPNEMPGVFEGHPEHIGEWVPQGPGKLARGIGETAAALYSHSPEAEQFGIHGATPQELLHGVSETASGLGNTLLPAVPFLAAAAPWVMARGYGLGLVASEVGGQVAKAVGASPQTRADVENLAFWAPALLGGNLKAYLDRGYEPHTLERVGNAAGVFRSLAYKLNVDL